MKVLAIVASLIQIVLATGKVSLPSHDKTN